MEFTAGNVLEKGDTQVEEIIGLAGRRAENFYDAHRLCCSEAVMLVLNQAFGGTLSPEMAISLGAGFCGGMRAGCLCGALSGAVMGLGQFLAPNQPNGLSKKRFGEVNKNIHDRFKERYGATCCRVLSKNVKHDKKAHKKNCLRLTGGGAELAVEILLESRPELLARADMEFLKGRDSKLAGLIAKLRGKTPGGVAP